MFFDREIDRIFQRLSNPRFGVEDIFEELGKNCESGTCYGYAVTVGPDGKPAVREFGDARPGIASPSGVREPPVETIVDAKERVVKLIAEMPGVEKSDVKIVTDSKTVSISAERDGKRYHADVPIRHKVDEDSAKASYRNGVLQVTFGLADGEDVKTKTVEVE